MRAIAAVAFVLSLAAAAGCDDPTQAKASEIQQKLVGTWLREIDHGNDKAQRVLVLQANGKFSETLVVRFADGRRGKETRAGDWSFDGHNLKRRYTHEDGRQLSGNFNFGTFALTSFDGKQFVGKNHAHGDVIEYRRVPDGTVPQE